MSNDLATVLNELTKAYGELEPEIRNALGWTERETWVYNETTGRNEYKKELTEAPEVPIITVAPRGKRKANSWFTPAVWKSDTDEAMAALTQEEVLKRAEITLATDVLDMPVKAILNELALQTLHLEIEKFGYWGSMTDNGYVTTQFNTYAHKLGYTSNYNSEGYIIDNKAKNLVDGTVIDGILDKVVPLVDDEVFDIHRGSTSTSVSGKGSPLKKYQCKCTNIRSAVYVQGTCTICNEPFEYADKDKDNDNVKSWLDTQKARMSVPWRVEERKNKLR